jgi:hypothetical protein
MDFREAETRFFQLRENHRNGAISEESFLKALSQLMIQDAQGKYWTIDPKTGDWLYYDGHTWQPATPPTGDVTVKLEKIQSVPRRRGDSWVVALLAGGLMVLGFLVVVVLVAYRMLSATSPPEVIILSPSNGAEVSVGQDVPVESVSSDSKGIDRVELWVDDALVVPETKSPPGSPVAVTLRWIFRRTGSHRVKVKAYSTTGLVGESEPVVLNAVQAPEEGGPSLIILQGSAEIRTGTQESWRPIQGGTSVQVGETVRTSDDGRVQLVFAEGPVTELGGTTELLLEKTDLENGTPPVIGLSLLYGDSWHRLEAQETGIRYEIETPSALIVLQGMLVHILSSPDGGTVVEALEGEAVVIAAGQQHLVPTGQRARVEPGGPPVLVEEPELLARPDAASTNTPDCRYDAVLIADVAVPVGAVLQPGQRVEKIWRMRNTGDCPWLDYTWTFISGDSMGGPDTVPVPRTEPGGTADISVPLHVPSLPGTYTGIWGLKNAEGLDVGQTARVQVKVLTTPFPVPSPTREPMPTTIPTPSVSFRIDRDYLNLGECARLSWDVANVQSMYLDGVPVVEHDSGRVCPSETTHYTLCWRHGGRDECQTITVVVNAPYSPPYY